MFIRFCISYNSFIFNFFLVFRLASLSCEVAQCMPSCRIRLFCDMCSLLNRPFFFSIMRTHSRTMLIVTMPIAIKTLFIIVAENICTFSAQRYCFFLMYASIRVFFLL